LNIPHHCTPHIIKSRIQGATSRSIILLAYPGHGSKHTRRVLYHICRPLPLPSAPPTSGATTTWVVLALFFLFPPSSSSSSTSSTSSSPPHCRRGLQ
jgi:hypothetical protein